MYRPKRYIRLNQLPRMPRVADVRNLFDEGKKNRSCTVEMPWRTEKLGMTFSLTVRVDVGGSEPIWTLYEGEGNRSRVMWSTGFADVELLYDVLTLSLPTDGPNIFAPVEEALPPSPVAEAAAAPSYFDSDQYKAQSTAFETGARSPFLDNSDQFMKPESFETFSKGGSKKESSNEFAISKPLATSDMINPLAEPQIALGQHLHSDGAGDFTGNLTNNLTSDNAVAGSSQQNMPAQAAPAAVPQSAPQNPLQPTAFQNTNFTEQFVSSAAGGANQAQGQPQSQPQGQGGTMPLPYPVAPAYPGPMPPPGYPPYPQAQGGYPNPVYPPQNFSTGQYPQQQYPGQYPPGYPMGSGQYPQAYPPYNMPPGSVPLSAGAPGAGPMPAFDQYGMPIMPPVMAHKRPAVMLGSLLVDAGLVPKTTIDAALQVQVLVSQGTLSPVKAAEAVRRAHLRGGAVEAEENAVRPNEMVVRIKPQIGQVLVMAGIITAVQLKAALFLQESMKTGSMSAEEAVELLRREASTAQVQSQSAEQIKAPIKEDLTRVIALLKQAGLLNDADLEAADKVKAKHGGEIAKILMAAGKLDSLTLDAAKGSQDAVDAGKIRVDQAIMGLHYCQRMRVPFEEAAAELGYTID